MEPFILPLEMEPFNGIFFQLPARRRPTNPSGGESPSSKPPPTQSHSHLARIMPCCRITSRNGKGDSPRADNPNFLLSASLPSSLLHCTPRRSPGAYPTLAGGPQRPARDNTDVAVTQQDSLQSKFGSCFTFAWLGCSNLIIPCRKIHPPSAIDCPLGHH